ncbi:hypothetical protein K435DRAFT_968329 [Dendrothele bispora CBS 962.96]|uniref:SAP domain-containing protein n=1 Tax=Dendrothele bispora (strain CBS 962.96) TaxID=1314807 RepID=A0A4V4HEH9_DENBC|nr:hypothetical protein K435DRAFT_968329 [Dendrothele bispora CBS 962.96]
MAEDGSALDLVQKAYQKLNRSELCLFLKVRNLPTSGSESELASRLANHDRHHYHFPISPWNVPPTPPSGEPYTQPPQPSPDLPIEIIADILDHLGDWEMTQALRVPTSIPRPADWTRATPTDFAMITGNLALIRAADPVTNPPTKIGADTVIRFGYVNVLEFFLSQHHDLFLSVFQGDIIPIRASRYGSINVLSWWKHGFEQHPDLVPRPKTGSVAEAIHAASRRGQITSLDWWVKSRIPLDYTEAALNYASAKNQVAVLEWWKQQHKINGLQLKIGQVMDAASAAGHVEVLEWWATSQLDFKWDRHALYHASCNGKVEVLQWWLGSGLQLQFDHDVLTSATRLNRVEVLEWWDKSGLPVQYRMCDIEEALEDAIGGGQDTRRWWMMKGVDFNANDREWMKLQNLN